MNPQHIEKTFARLGQLERHSTLIHLAARSGFLIDRNTRPDKSRNEMKDIETMRVKVKDIVPNKFRDMEHYPIQKDKITALRKSFQNTGVWPVILGRKSPDDPSKIEIAFGHHRWVAMKEEFDATKTVEIHVSKFDDAMMLKLMANENLEEYGHKFGVTLETVRQTMKFLAGEDCKWLDVNATRVRDFLGWKLTRVECGVRASRLISSKAPGATPAAFNNLSVKGAETLASQIAAAQKQIEADKAEREARAEKAKTEAQAELIRRTAADKAEREKKAAAQAIKQKVKAVTSGKESSGSIKDLGYTVRQSKPTPPKTPSESSKELAKVIDGLLTDDKTTRWFKEIDDYRDQFSDSAINRIASALIRLAERAGVEAAKLTGYDAKEAAASVKESVGYLTCK